MEEPLTVQWAGDLAVARERLLGAGWIEAQPWSARTVLSWLAPVPDPLGLPAWPLLQEGRVPAMTLVRPLTGDSRLVLRLWATSVLATDGQALPEPLWVGAVAEEQLRRPLGLLTVSTAAVDATGPRQVLARSVDDGRLALRTAAPATAAWDGRVLLVR
jgi:undecaprenyl-diphosphatase